MQYNKETLDEVFGDLQKILPKHYEELTLNKNKIKLNPDWDKYRLLEDSKKLVIYTAREKSVLIGYAFFFIDTHIHYKDLKVATNDVLFMLDEYRGTAGLRFLRYCHETLLPQVDKIVFHVKDSNDFSPILTKRYGYKKEDSLYGHVK